MDTAVSLTRNASETVCPNCGHGGLRSFYEVRGVPVHSVLQLNSREAAASFPKRDIELALCSNCAFITNCVFDSSVHKYSADYEETQGYSSVFQQFQNQLAQSLIFKYNLHGKHIIEIGCGKGEFLALLCELGDDTGIGFDPAFVAERNPVKGSKQVEFVADFYSEKYSDIKGDFICCKMTLEHISNTSEFLTTVRRSIGSQTDSVVFFMIPNMARVLEDLAFWDVYYEHCSYFTLDSLVYLFESTGFDVLETTFEYDSQYLTISALPVEAHGTAKGINKDGLTVLEDLAHYFADHCSALIAKWRRILVELKATGKKAVIWGAGSKGVAFLSAIGPENGVEYAVDINPFRHGKFMAGTAQEIVSPQFLLTYKPDVVIAMNSIYRSEIKAELDRMRLPSALMVV